MLCAAKNYAWSEFWPTFQKFFSQDSVNAITKSLVCLLDFEKIAKINDWLRGTPCVDEGMYLTVQQDLLTKTWLFCG